MVSRAGGKPPMNHLINALDPGKRLVMTIHYPRLAVKENLF